MAERHYKGRYDTVELSTKAIRMANWREQAAHQVMLTTLLPFDKIEIYDGQRLFFARALQALTQEELLHLHSELLRAHRDCLLDGGDFTHEEIRKAQPHLYPEAAGTA